MTLPTIVTPTYELEIPSNKEKLTYRPFLVKEEKILLLATETGEENDMVNAIKRIINNCTYDKIDIETLALFDLEYIFLRIRAKSVGEITTIKVLCDDDGETYADVEINLEEVNVTFPKGHSNKIELTDSVGIIMQYPQINFMSYNSDLGETESIFTMFKECINQIYDGETVHERGDFTEKELDEFLESLSSDHFKKLQDFFETMPRIRQEIKFKNPKTKKVNKQTLEGLNNFFV